MPPRAFTAAWALLAALAICSTAAWADPLSGAKLKIRPVVPLKVHAFAIKDVPGPGWYHLYPNQWMAWNPMGLNLGYLGTLEADRLLYNFRVTAGLPAPRQSLGGWEHSQCEFRGHFVGHYLSASAMISANPGCDRHGTFNRETVARVMAGLAACQAKFASGYLGAFPEAHFDRLEAGKPVWAPYCVLHKIMAGLLDMYVCADSDQALVICRRLGDWVVARISRLSERQVQKILEADHGGMCEVLANLYGLTGDAKYLAAAQRFLDWTVLGPASRREDRLTGLEANAQVAKFIGAARLYELTGDERLRTAAVFFWDTVVKERCYVVGGTGKAGRFTPKETLSQALGPNTCETCATCNMLKLTRHLFCWEPKVEYADYYERAVLNHILAAQGSSLWDGKDGMVCYYLPLAPPAKRAYSSPTDSFWCCLGAAAECHARHTDTAFFRDSDKGLYVNQYVAATLKWQEKEVEIEQATSYPHWGCDRIGWTFRCPRPVELTLHVRRPAWATAGFSAKLNDQPLAVSSTPGSYAAIARTWKNGDRLEVQMPFTLRTEAFRDNPRRLAILHGPVVLAGEVDPGRPAPVIVAEEGKLLTSYTPGRDETFIWPADIFRVAGQKSGKAVTLRPLYEVGAERGYVVYWDTCAPGEWPAREAATVGGDSGRR